MPKLTPKQAADYINALPLKYRAFTLINTKGGQIRLLDAHGVKMHNTGGHGYSKGGVSVAAFIEKALPDALLLAAKSRGANYGSSCTNKKGLYGLCIYRPNNPQKPKQGSRLVTKWRRGDKVGLQGMCGIGCMFGVMEAAGIKAVEVAHGDGFTVYSLQPLTNATYTTQAASRARGEAIRAALGYKVNQERGE